MQSASQYDQHVRAHLQSIQEDAFARGEWSSEDVFECEKGCGFEDAAENVVVAHEATCVFESVPEEQAAAAEPEPAEIYECEKGCGFENASEATVVAHEATCVFESVPEEEVLTDAARRKIMLQKRVKKVKPKLEPVYECEKGCGFEDASEDVVVAHEATCAFESVAEGPAPTEVYECEKGCGFEDALEATVVAHEAVCVFEPREYECEMGCGFVDICEASLVAHEATCTYTKLEQVRHTLYASPDRTPTVS